MDFPRYVFTSEGKDSCKLGTYGTAIVENENEFKAALKSGFKEEVTELFEKPATKKVAPVKEKLIFNIEDIEGYTKAQVIDFLEEQPEKVTYNKKDTKASLVGMLRELKKDSSSEELLEEDEEPDKEDF